MTDTYAIVIHPDCRIDLVKTCGGYREYQRLVGGHFENTPMKNICVSDLIMTVDEEGKLKGKPINPVATFLQGAYGDFIVGDAVILKLVRVGELKELDQVPFDRDEAHLLLRWFELIRDKYVDLARDALETI